MQLFIVDGRTQSAKNRSMDMSAIGRRLRLRRSELRLSQEELSDRTKEIKNKKPTQKGVSLGTIQNIERAERKPKEAINSTEPTLAVIAKALEWLPDQLIRGNDPPQPTDPKWAGLKEEHLELTKEYVYATRVVQDRIRAILANAEPAKVTELAVRMNNLPTEVLKDVEEMISAAEHAQQNTDQKKHDEKRKRGESK